MNDKEKLKYEIERLKSQIKNNENRQKSDEAQLAKLTADYERSGPRMFLIREMEDDGLMAIAGRREKLVVVEVYTEQDQKSLGPKDIFVKEATK